jgi:Icc-related predicted phosphoesterase
MRIGVTSDLHGYLPEIEPCDILCICGDICPTTNHSLEFQKSWLENEFFNWCKNLHTEIIFIAGNHDFIFQNEEYKKQLFPKIEIPKYTSERIIQSQKGILTSYWPATYLENESITIHMDQTIKIFGTPYCKQFGNWAFMRDNKTLDDKYSEIPDDVDILLSHDAPRLLDAGVILDSDDQFNAGNPILADYVLVRKPKYVFCGHIHSGNHNLQTVENTQIANVSLVDENYQPVNKVLYFDY